MISGQVLLFDLGGVLVETTVKPSLRALTPDIDDERLVLERWNRSKAVGLFERGRVSPEEFAQAFVREWGIELDHRRFLEAFADWICGFYPGAQAMLRRVGRYRRVACLSNTNVLHWARLPEAPKLFSACFASHISGFRKPEIKGYEHASRTLGARPEEVYFFDDSLEYVDAARRCGFNAFQVQGLAETEEALRKIGL